MMPWIAIGLLVLFAAGRGGNWGHRAVRYLVLAGVAAIVLLFEFGPRR